MSLHRWACWLAIGWGCWASQAWGGGAPEPLEAEALSTGSIDPTVTQRVYVADIAIGHISDGRIRVFDARQGRFLGMVSTAYAGNFSVHPQRRELYVATTHLSRSTRGERTDVLEVHDTESLAFQYEVVLPTKRAQALNYRGLVRSSSDGQWVYVQNATPATSITVVDLAQRKVLSEVATPGCWGVLPAATHARRISMLCGDGKVATLTLDASGQVQERRLSEKLFDADHDAWFHHAEQLGDRYWFVSFQGRLTQLDLGGAVAQVIQAHELPKTRSSGRVWRPGGYQLFAVHPSGRYAVLAMHAQGGEGSHKRPAQQLWVMDLDHGQRLATWPGVSAIALTFSHDGQRLHALDGETGALRMARWQGPQHLSWTTVVKRAGESSMHMESHD